MGEQMDFPESFNEFIDDYSFKDTKEEYTNGSELIPVFRVKQAADHYFNCFRWRPISEYSRDKYDWVLIQYYVGGWKCVPATAEMRDDGRWYTQAGECLNDITNIEIFEFFDMQNILKGDS